MQRENRKKQLTAALCLLAPLLALALAPLPDALEQGAPALACGAVQLALALGVAWALRDVLRRGAQELARREPGGAALALLGACAGLAYGVLALGAGAAAGGPVRRDWYFEAAALLPALAAAGEWFWQQKLEQAAAPLFRVGRRARSARRLQDGAEQAVDPAALRPGDRVLVRAGEVIPADGAVCEGVGAVREQALTGEKAPVKKFPGSAVCAGTVLKEGTLTCEVERAGAATVQARLAALVTECAAGEGPLARWAGQFARKTARRALALAAAAFLLWLAAGFGPGRALGAALAVLAVGSPTALLPGVTAALCGAAGSAAVRGVYFRTLAALEQAAEVRAVGLDAAAALDAGEPEVVQVAGTRRVPEKFLLSMAAGLCLQAADPLARAILRRAEADGVKYTAVAGAETVPGQGLQGKVAGKVIAGGGAAFIAGFCPLPPDLLEAGQALERRGATPLYFVLAGSPAGVIGISRSVRPDAAPRRGRTAGPGPAGGGILGRAGPGRPAHRPSGGPGRRRRRRRAGCGGFCAKDPGTPRPRGAGGRAAHAARRLCRRRAAGADRRGGRPPGRRRPAADAPGPDRPAASGGPGPGGGEERAPGPAVGHRVP